MNTPDDEPGDELSREYRRASDSQAGSPAAATRAAILAEARAAALRRTPAANDSRHVWRAVAGIAVLGVAMLLWRQVDRRLTPDLTVATTTGPKATMPPSASAPTPAPTPEDRPATPTADEAAAAQPARASADAVATIEAVGATRKDSIDYRQLLQREFPEVWNGNEPPHTVWVVVDANGKVLRKGELSPGAAITPDQPFETQKPWRVVRVTTASGSSLQLAVMPAN